MRKRGSAALFGLGIMVILLTVTLGATSLAIGSMRRTSRDRDNWMAYQAAQAGLEEEITRAKAAMTNNNGQFGSSSRNIASEVNSMAPGAVATATVSPLSNPRYAYVTSSVTYRTFNRSLRSLVSGKDVSIWNNAVFAGTGAAGKAINGNVDIRGSMHILGDGERYSDLNGNSAWDPAEPYTDKNKNGVWDPGELYTDTNHDGVWTNQEPYNDTNKNNLYDPPLTQTDLSESFLGAAYVGNHYSGMPAALEAQVAPAPKVNNIETLSAEIRVKHGRISIGGNATIGSSGVVDGGTSKNTVDGTYVSDGYTGNKGASSVYSDNGTSNSYDLDGEDIYFPYISGIGAKTFVDKTNTSWTDMAMFYDNRALTIPVTTITKSTTAFSYGPDTYGNSISFTPESGSTPAKLTVNGVVRVNSNLQLGSKDTIRTLGRGTIYCTGSINIDGNITPMSGLVFPTTTALGLVAKYNLNLATGPGSSQLTMVGAFYAQGNITSVKQNQIAGTFVGNFFDMGLNVPNLYQVPALPYNMPPYMPGDWHFFSVKARNWRDR